VTEDLIKAHVDAFNARDLEALMAGDGQAAAQLTEVFTFEGVERTDHIAGFYVVRQGRITAAKIYREGSADVAG
jgi:uncharacterized protein